MVRTSGFQSQLNIQPRQVCFTKVRALVRKIWDGDIWGKVLKDSSEPADVAHPSLLRASTILPTTPEGSEKSFPNKITCTPSGAPTTFWSLDLKI